MAITGNQIAKQIHWTPSEVKIVGDRVIKYENVIVYQFRIGDVEDPDLYAGNPLAEWQQTVAGKWCMENAVEKPFWTRHPDYNSYGYEYTVVARFTEANHTFFRLKYVGTTNRI